MQALTEPEPEPTEPTDEELAGIEPVPLDAKLEDRLVRAVLAVPARPTAPAPRRWWRRPRIITAATATLMAAAALLIVPRIHTGPVADTLPLFTDSIATIDDTMGGDPTAPPAKLVADLDSPLRLELVPDVEVKGDFAVRPYLRRDGRLVPWKVTPARTPRGVVRLTARIRELPQLGPGQWDLIFVLAPIGKLPTDDEIARAVDQGPPAGAPWQLHRFALTITAAAPAP